MTDALIAYCPEIDEISGRNIRPYGFDRYETLTGLQRNDLIAAALVRRIKERGEWNKFCMFATKSWAKESANEPQPAMFTSHFVMFEWLTDPSTLIRVAGEWVGRRRG